MVGKKLALRGRDDQSAASLCTSLQTRMLGKETGTGASGRVACDVVIFLWVFSF